MGINDPVQRDRNVLFFLWDNSIILVGEGNVKRDSAPAVLSDETKLRGRRVWCHDRWRICCFGSYRVLLPKYKDPKQAQVTTVQMAIMMAI